MEGSAKIQLRIPEQDLRQLTFDGATAKKLADWIEALPKVNVGETSRQLYAAIQEVNRLQTDSETRFSLLEELRPSIHYVCKALGKHFLNQSIILPEKEGKIANLAQALQNHLAVGYKIVIIESLQVRSAESHSLRTKAIHRALSELSGNLLRCYQLYYPTPKGLWLELHQLYLLARHNETLNTRISDQIHKSELSILECYTRAMMLCTSRPNQLRQKEIALIYKKFGEWSKHCKLVPASGKSQPFLVDLNQDSGPVYSQWSKEQMSANAGDNKFYVIMSELALKLSKTVQNPHIDVMEDPDILDIKGLAPNVTRHLVQSWSASSQRAFARTATDGVIGIAFGLGAVHHYISGGQDFNDMLTARPDDENENPFLKRKKSSRSAEFKEEMRGGGDVWSLQTVATDIQIDYDAPLSTSAGATDTSDPRIQTLFPAYQAQLVDTSPGGYCVQWNAAAPAQLKTGEVVAVREAKQKIWSIAAVRWIKKMSSSSARLGLELLAPHAEACGAKVIHKSGESTEYMRTIRLPELKAIGQPSTLIMPQLTFKTGYKIMVNIRGKDLRAQLSKEVSSTASFSQFEYKLVGTMGATQDGGAGKPDSGDEFDSLWTSL